MNMKRITLQLSLGLLLFISPAMHAQTTTDKPLKVRINHIAVYVFDLEKSRNFYENVLQLTWMKNPFNDGMHEWFSIGDAAQLHLIKGAAAPAEHIKNSHLCFSVASVNDFIGNLKKHHIGYTNWPGEADSITVRPDGIKQIYFKDPDGHWLEVNDDHQ